MNKKREKFYFLIKDCKLSDKLTPADKAAVREILDDYLTAKITIDEALAKVIVLAARA